MDINKNVTFATIFDMDGVLLDSPKLNWHANNEVLSKHGVNVPVEEFSLYLGTTLKDAIRMFNEKYNISLDYDEFRDATDIIKKDLFADIQPKEGVVQLLSDLSRNSIPIAVATSMPRNLTEERLNTAGILHFFDLLVTENDVKKHKPDPEVFLKAAEGLTTDPSQCTVFEDAPAGVTAAVAAGMHCIAIQTDFVLPGKLYKAEKIIKSLKDISAASLQAMVKESKI